MVWFIIFLSLLITIVTHEAGHCISSILLKVKVETFSIGFWKPSLGFNLKGIRWQVTPWLLGGYCKIKGELSKEKDGLLSKPYYKKVIILLSGVFVNLIIALICYLINYGDIFVGLKMDWLAIQVFFTKDYSLLVSQYLIYKPNLFLWQLSMVNVFCFGVNLIPWPSLDGSLVWLYLMEPVWKENFEKNLQKICKIGFISLNILQAVILIWMFI